MEHCFNMTILNDLLPHLIEIASNDGREGPWYGPWNLILIFIIFGNHFCQLPFITSTFPQFPLAQNQATADGGNDDAEDEDDDENDTNNEFTDMRPAPSMPVTPIRPPRDRASAPSPDASARRPQILTPSDTGSPDSTRAFWGSPFGPKSWSYFRSTRIPDFVQLLFKIAPNNPSGYLTRALLIVEIKKRPKSGVIHEGSFITVMIQTLQQARHAFAFDLQVQRLGVIIGFADSWLYREYTREDTTRPFYRSVSEETYHDTTPVPQSRPSVARTYTPVERHFVGGFAVLGTPNSDRALQEVRKRMEEFRDEFLMSSY